MNFEQLANDLKSGKITLSEWEAAMREFIRDEFRTALLLAKGDPSNITPSDWGYLGSLIKEQYQYLDNFAQDIVNDPAKWLFGNALQKRMSLYGEAAYSALSDMLALFAMQNGFTEERNRLGDADHCPECLQETSKSWQPINSLIPIGERICTVRCKCTMEYRRLNSDGSYTYG